MIADDTALTFIVEYFELLQSDRDRLAAAYSDTARVIINFRDRPPAPQMSPFLKGIPIGSRSLFQCSGEVISGLLYVHVRSRLFLASEAQVVDEAFVCSLTPETITIQYHSIHIGPVLSETPVLPPPRPAVTAKAPEIVRPPPKPKIDPVEVTSMDQLDGSKSVIVKNLPFISPPSEYLPVLVEHFGPVVKYVQQKGVLGAEFQEKEARDRAVHSTWEKWKGRLANVLSFEAGQRERQDVSVRDPVPKSPYQRGGTSGRRRGK